ncbi:S8 family serine peptidase [uncultured Aquimarina sp.]|uniref:S8 family serine peptidase n=1 Tax=uncultured Aquimarina sp. TaxID=575652 RepID=UPI00262227AE|nr:S8 family serine peptidase [uncultured Aquimarina sp.]
MKTLRYILTLLFFLLFLQPILSQQKTVHHKNQTTTAEESSDDDDDDDDDNDDDDDEDEDEDEDEIIKHPSLYFVKLSPSITQEAVDKLLSDLNSDEIWYRSEINLRLWNTRVFPYIDAMGQSVTNINTQVTTAEEKTDVDGVDFNIGHIAPRTPVDIQGFCFENIVPQYGVGNNPIKISIFDTGITQNSGTFPGYSFSLPEYTGYDYVDDDEVPEDLNGHGTHIAGVIHHLLSYGGAPTSVTFDIRKTHDVLGRGFVSHLIPAILDAVNEGANILNFSFSYKNKNVNTTGKPLRLAVDYAEQMGAMVIAAAGNTNENNDTDNIISFPASYPNTNILSVASTDCDNKLSPFSSYGQQTVDVALLGENIPGPGLTGTIGYESGTSFTSANVTALAAILGTHQATFDYQQIRCVLINTSTTSSDLFEKVVANGAINFSTAFNQMNNACNTPIQKSSAAVTPKSPSIFFPNPFNEMLQLKFNKPINQQITISIYNQSGVLILQNQFYSTNDQHIIDIKESNQLNPGIYYAKVDTPNNSHTQIIIKK